MKILVLFIFLLSFGSAISQIATDGDFRSIASGTWNGNSTWQKRIAGSWTSTAAAPTSTSNVYIQTGHTITVNITTVNCNDLNIDSNGVLAIGTNLYQVSGKIRTYRGTANISAGTDGTFYSGQTSTIRPGAVSITSTSPGKLSFIGSTRSITFNGEWGPTLAGADFDINMTTGQTATLNTNAQAKNWTVTQGIFNITNNTLSADDGTTAGKIKIYSEATVRSSSNLNNLFQKSPNVPADSLIISGTLILTGANPNFQVLYYNFSGGTIQYSGTNQKWATNGIGTNKGNKPLIYSNVIISNSGTKTTIDSQTVTINDSLTMSGTATCVLGSSGTLIYGSSGSLIYSGSSIQHSSAEFPSSSISSLTINNSSQVVLNGNKSISGELNLNSGVLNDSVFTLTAAGNITGAGTHTGNGSLKMIGSGKTISISSVGNLELNNSGGFNMGSDLTLTGTLTLTSGIFTINAHTLTIQDTIFQSLGSLNSNTNSIIIVNGSQNGIILPTGIDHLSVFTLNNPNGVTLSSYIEVNYLNLTSGTIQNSGYTIYVSNDISGTGTVSGTGFVEILNMATTIHVSGVTLPNVDIYSFVNLTAPVTINGDLYFTNGDLNNNGYTVTVGGNIFNNSASLSGGGKIYMTGTGAKTISGISFADLELNNASGFTLTGNVNVSGTLTLTAGNLAVASNTLTLQNPIAGTITRLITTSSSNLVISGSGTAFTIPASIANLSSLTLNYSSGATAGSAFTITNDLNIANGNLGDGGNIITVTGNVTGSGTHSGTGKIRMTGSGKNISGVTFTNLQLTNAGGFTLTGDATVSGTLQLTTGPLNIGAHTFTIQNAIAGTSTNLVTTSASSLRVSGTGSGILLPSSVTALNNLTVSNSNGLTTSSNVNISGTANITGLLILNNFNLNQAGGSATLSGNGTIRLTNNLATQIGSYNSNSFSGTYQLNGATHTIPAGNYGSITLNSTGASLSGDISISGILTLTSGVLTIGANTLSLSNNIVGSSSLLSAGSTSSIAIIGSSSNIILPSNITVLNSLIVNNTNGFSLSAAINLSGDLNLSSGTLRDSGFTITLSGNITGSGSETGTGKILMNGSGKLISGANLTNLECNNPGGFGLSGNTVINGILTLTDGLFNINSGNTLTICNAIAGTPSNLRSVPSLSSLTIGGTGSGISLPSNCGTLYSLTVSNPNGFTLNNNCSLNGDLTLNSGTLNDGGYIINLYGNLNGTGTHAGSGKIVMKNTSASLSGATLENLEINGQTARSVSLNGNPVITGTLTLTSGNLSIGGYTLTIQKPMVIADYTGIITSASSSIVVSGSGSGITLGVSVLANLTINNPNGLSLDFDLSVKNIFLTSGKISIGSYIVYIQTGGTVTGGSGTSYVRTNGIGGGLRYLNMTNGSPHIFPVGNSSYNPVIINNTSGTIGDWMIAVKDTISDGTIGSNKIVKREWNITPSVLTGNTASITLQWNNADEDPTFIRGNSLFMAHYNSAGGGNNWFPTSSTLAVDGTEGPTSHITTASGFTSFSPFAVANDGPLPVELASFTSTLNGRNANLSWTTKTEINNSGFDIERKSTTASDWIKIGYAAGNGTSNVSHSYNYSDRNLTTANYKYRLKQIDNNGNFHYFDLTNEVIIGVPGDFSLSQNYPNPFNPVTKINYDLPVDSKVNIKLFDISGREIATILNSDMHAGYQTLSFDAGSLSSGTYFYNINASGNGKSFSKTLKMMLIK